MIACHIIYLILIMLTYIILPICLFSQFTLQKNIIYISNVLVGTYTIGSLYYFSMLFMFEYFLKDKLV